MTIEQAREVPEVTEDQAAAAEAEAGHLAAEAERLHAAALAGGKGAPTAAEIADARAMADLAAEIAVIRRAEAGRHAEAERLRAVEALGKDVDKFAAKAAADTGISAKLAALVRAREEFLTACAAHNDGLRQLRARGTALGIAKLPMSGELSAASAYVHDANGEMRTANSHVHHIDQRTAEYAVTVAAAGDGRRAALALGQPAEIYAPVKGQ